MAVTKLSAPNGASVSVDSERVDNLIRYGFTKPSETAKAPTKKATSSKTKK